MRDAQLQWLEPHGVSPENDEWYTPEWLFEALGVQFDLDPCSPGAPPSRVPAREDWRKFVASGDHGAVGKGCGE